MRACIRVSVLISDEPSSTAIFLRFLVPRKFRKFTAHRPCQSARTRRILTLPEDRGAPLPAHRPGCRVPSGRGVVAVGVRAFGVAASPDLTHDEAAATIAWPVRAPAERVGVESVGCHHQRSDWI
jgi:hypothetical protein